MTIHFFAESISSWPRLLQVLDCKSKKVRKEILDTTAANEQLAVVKGPQIMRSSRISIIRTNVGWPRQSCLTGKMSITSLPSVTNVEKLFGIIFKLASPPDNEPFDPVCVTSGSVYSFISEDEVRAAQSRWQISAPKSDQVPVIAVKQMSLSELAILYTIIISRNVQPLT